MITPYIVHVVAPLLFISLNIVQNASATNSNKENNLTGVNH